MSKNFELLRRAGKENALFGRPCDDVPSSHDEGHRDVKPIEPVRPAANGHGGPSHRTKPQEEALRLVQRVFLFPNSHAPRAVVFSSIDGNGSSEICYRAGEALASQGSSVCLVDANLRAPSLHQLFGVLQAPGLADATVRPGSIKNFAARIAGGNLWLVPSGSPTAAAQGLFASGELRSRVEELKREFDYVLIDTPPVSSNGDAVVLGQMADGVILVVEANSTRRETARIVKETFEGARIKLLGAILNNRTFPIPEALYRKL